MSIDHNGALLYGFSIPLPARVQGEDWRDRFNRVLNGFEGVGYAECEHGIYLCTFFKSVDRYDRVKRFPLAADAEQYARWDGLLSAAARALGVQEHDVPEWTLVYYED